VRFMGEVQFPEVRFPFQNPRTSFRGAGNACAFPGRRRARIRRATDRRPSRSSLPARRLARSTASRSPSRTSTPVRVTSSLLPLPWGANNGNLAFSKHITGTDPPPPRAPTPARRDVLAAHRRVHQGRQAEDLPLPGHAEHSLRRQEG
jgi:hypothetical protein